MKDKINHNPNEKQNSQVKSLSNTKVPRIVEQMIAHLKKGKFAEAANIFMTGQTQGIFSADGKPIIKHQISR